MQSKDFFLNKANKLLGGRLKGMEAR